MPDCYISFEKYNPNTFAEIFFEDRSFQNAYIAQKDAAELFQTDYQVWFNLSFYALFVGKPEEAISAAHKTLELNPEALDVETNLALGYLLSNRWQEAEAVYKKWKGRYFPNDDGKRKCEDIFLQDILDLEKAGVSHPDFERVKVLLRE